MKLIKVFFILYLFFFCSCDKKDSSNSINQFRVGLSTEPLTWDWSKAKDLISLGVLDNLVRPLIEIEHLKDGDFALGEGLLRNWKQSSKNKKEWSFELSKKAFWSDGTRVSLKQIEASLNHLIKNKDDSLCSSEIQKIDSVGVDKLNENLKIKTKIELKTLPKILTMICFSPFKNERPKSWNFVGTGDFRVQSYESGKGMVLKRVKKNSKAIEKIRFVFLNSWSAALNLFEAGELDFVPVIPTLQIKRFQNSSSFNFDESFTTSFLVLNSKKGPFTQLKVRSVLKNALSKTNFEKVLYGFKSTNSFVPSLMLNTKIYQNQTYKKPSKINPEVEIDLPCVDHENYKLTAQYLQSLLKPYGFNINIKLMDWKSFFHEINSGEASIYFRSWTAHWGHPVEFFNHLDKKNLSESDKLWSEEVFDSTSNVVLKLEQMQNQEISVVPLFEHKQYYLMNPKFTGFSASPLLKFNFKNVMLK